jgi:Fe-S cluster biogenesis protein NfuA
MCKTMMEEVRNDLHQRISSALDKIRPYLEADGGGITLEEVTDDYVVKVKLHGACDGCPFSYQTLKAGVEQALHKEIPEIKEVVAVD